MSFKVLLPAVALMLAAGCQAAPSGGLAGSSIGEVTTNIVQAVNAGETNRFTEVLDSTASTQVPQLFGMIKRSGMLTNFTSRIDQQSPGQARLNYHDLSRGCHFQIDLQTDGVQWKVKRIWFCR